ncbi:adenylate/guanylate cyclase domain-containing protein [Leptospira sp. 'Mane']|uniref:adenylate/guanylate cyclase domain-containing protein n=1 Tax=Leptospira sp. 'Mane' TaxID=3387407 RepID=UPI00398B8C1F
MPYYFKKSVLLLFVLGALFLSCQKQGRKASPASKGILDLETWDFTKDGIVALDGEWEFYWNQTYEEVSSSRERKTPASFLTVSIPSTWKGLEAGGKTLGGFGYGTYRLKLKLPDNNPPLAIHNLDLSSAYRLYVNGKLIHEEGRVSRFAESYAPSYKPGLFDLENLSGETEIVYEVANYHYPKGGFWESAEIGERKQVYGKLNRIYQITSFIAGSIFLWALYHIGLFIMRRQDRASLFIALFSLFLVLRILTTGERVLTSIIPEIPMDVLIRLEFSTLYIATAVFAYFYHLVFPQTLGKKNTWILLALIAPFIASLLFPVHQFASLALYFQLLLILVCLRIIGAIIHAFPKDKVGASMSLTGFLLVCIALTNDILYQNNVINTMNLTPFGFLLFILFQGYILSYGFTRAYESIEKLKENLEGSNEQLNNLKEGLEDLVVERTKELATSRENIQRLNEFAKTLNSSLQLESIMSKAFEYLKEEVSCDSMILFLVNEEKGSIDYYKSVLSVDPTEEKQKLLTNLKFALQPESGVMYLVYKRNRPFRFSKVKEGVLTDSNQIMVDIVGKHPGMILPLVAQGKIIALLTLFTTEENVSFSKDHLRIAESTAEAIATAVINSMLIETLNKERNLAELARANTEHAKNEVIKLNEFSKKINSESSLDRIIQEMFDYILKTFGIEGTILQLIDTKKNAFYTYSTTNPDLAKPEHLQFAKNLIIPLNEKGGFVYKSFIRKRPLYLSRIPGYLEYTIDKSIIKNLELKSFIINPLIVQNNVIGMAYFTSYKEGLNLDRNELRRITGFCDQIAGAIQNSLLLQITEQERKKAESAKQEIQKLNEFAKTINSSTNLEGTLAEIFEFIKSNYRISNCVLYYLDNEFSEFRYLNHSGFDLLADENIFFFKNLKFQLNEKSGFVYKCYSRKRFFYMKKIPKKIPYEIDREIITKSGVSSILISPLINNDKVVAMAIFGIMDKEVQLNQEELTSIVGVSEHIAGAIGNNFLMNKIEEEKHRSDSLLLNILPKNVAEELQRKGRVNPVEFENVTMLMTSFPGFSQMTSQLTPEELLEGLDLYFSRFDEIIKSNNMEKLKMTGDMYVAAGGLPVGNFTHTIDACLAALQIREEANRIKLEFPDIAFKPPLITIAIHSGPVVAGVIGKTKFSYDVWGKTVTQTQAIRRGADSTAINISLESAEKVKRLFVLENQREINTYEGDPIPIIELKSLRSDFALESGIHPNEAFERLYTQQKRGARILIK